MWRLKRVTKSFRDFVYTLSGALRRPVFCVPCSPNLQGLDRAFLLRYKHTKRVGNKKGESEYGAGAFAENVLCRGLCLYELPVGTLLRVGSALCRVTQIGKECHADCAIRQQAGDCVMPREGIFAEVLEGGVARAGDRVIVLSDREADR